MNNDIYNPGEKIENVFVTDQIKKKINEMLEWNRRGFPGSNPVSLNNSNIKNIFTKEYLICEKTDGVRYFLFIASNTAFFIDRNYDIFKNDSIHVPTKEDLRKKQQLTLLDGELVEDILYNEKKGIEEKKIVYLIYDGLYIQRKNLTKMNYYERLAHVYNDVVIPLKMYREQKADIEQMQVQNELKEEKEDAESLKLKRRHLIIEKNINKEKSDQESSCASEPEVTQPIEIYLKDFYNIDQIEVLIKVMKKLPHPSDGIIFSPLHSPYVNGNCFTLLKWKPLNLNTVDFGIETVYDENNIPRNFELYISVKSTRTSYNCYLAPYGDVYKQLLDYALKNKISQQIVECYYVAKNIYSIFKNTDSTETKIEGGWVAQKIRFDKILPNDIRTLNKVIQSILDNITLETLAKEIKRNCVKDIKKTKKKKSEIKKKRDKPI